MKSDLPIQATVTMKMPRFLFFPGMLLLMKYIRWRCVTGYVRRRRVTGYVRRRRKYCTDRR